MTVSQIPSLTTFSASTVIASADVNANYAAIRQEFNLLLVAEDKMMLGDTANANLTIGITINQGANDDEILALKSSDVAHGYTSGTETDTYAALKKRSPTDGGLRVLAIMEDSGNSTALALEAYGGQADTTKSTAGRALTEVHVYEHDGANALADITANGNVFAVRARVGGSLLARWMVDEDGDTWQAGDITAANLAVTADVQIGIAGTGAIKTTSGDFIVFDDSASVKAVCLGLGVSGDSDGSLRIRRGALGSIGRDDVIVGDGSAMATTAVDGFFMIPGGAGPPTGTPTNAGEGYPFYWDATNDKFYVYSGWLARHIRVDMIRLVTLCAVLLLAGCVGGWNPFGPHELEEPCVLTAWTTLVETPTGGWLLRTDSVTWSPCGAKQ